MSDASDRFALPLLHAGQAQKEITHNEALQLIDMLMRPYAESASLTVPPGGETAGESWIVAAGASGAWAGQDGNLALMTSGGWRFVVPEAGLKVFVADTGAASVFDGSAWVADAIGADGYYVNGQRIIGARLSAITDPSGGSVIDTEARNAIGSVLAALRNHGMIDAA